VGLPIASFAKDETWFVVPRFYATCAHIVPRGAREHLHTRAVGMAISLLSVQCYTMLHGMHGDCVKYCLANVNARNDSGHTPLHFASLCGHVNVVRAMRIVMSQARQLNGADLRFDSITTHPLPIVLGLQRWKP
jgi:hypothetical protein